MAESYGSSIFSFLRGLLLSPQVSAFWGKGMTLGEGSSLLLKQTLKELTVGGCLHYVLWLVDM